MVAASYIRVCAGLPGARLALLLPLLCCLLLPAACLESRLPEGVAATVNGEPIFLRSVQALLDGRYSSPAAMRSPSLETMRREYGEALGTLILYALVRQELAQRRLSVSEEALEGAVNAVRRDYGGEEEFARYLTEQALDPVEWRALLYSHLSLARFEKLVLLPLCGISAEEARQYYTEHAADFRLPETVRVCLVQGVERQTADAACAALAAAPSAPSATDRKDVAVQCMLVRPGDVPREWHKALRGLAPGACVPARQEDGAWRALALLERRNAAAMSAAEAYPLVETVLREQKMAEAFARWQEQALARSSVRVAGELKTVLSASGAARTDPQEDAPPRRPAGGGLPPTAR
ncbi:MAG: peptidyl-prolyl cis-trans isomerase [Desulfovibrio desulfuricans]|jgi:hypothetical protein|nr:peptidyl-prolyl cis-trans isomerase [Desulfovibrio desulfuricans]